MKSNKKIKSKRKNKRNLYLLAFLIILILLILSLLIIIFSTYSSNNIIEKKEIYAELIIWDKIGLAKNNTALILGGIKRNGLSTKEINLLNNYGQDVFVEIQMEGNISDFIYISENDFILKSGESKNLSFSSISDKDSEYGKYNGYVYIIIKKI